jgi:thiol:disulfide interchange protein DsbD
MLGFAIALAGPFTLFAFFPSWLKNLPRSGGWLNTVKVLLGFFELAFSLKFLSVADLAYGWHILDREVFIVLWIVIFLMAGLYLLGKIKFKGDDDIDTISVPRIFAAGFCFSFMVYLVPGLFGAPLKAISAFAPPLWTQDLNLYEETQAKFTSYEEGMKYAKEHQKPVLVDFTGYGCVNCREMEAKIWNNPEVSSLLNNDYVLISLYVDDKRKLAEPMIITENGKEKKIRTIGEKWSYLQRHKFGANAQPFYVILNNNGEVINPPVGFTKNSLDFIKFLKKGLNNYQK